MPSDELDRILAELRNAADEDAEEEIAQRLLVPLLHRHSGILDQVLKHARRDNRVRRCLSSARYYSGLSPEMCERIDAVIQAPFPAARPRR